jgi:hypothetical protein
VFPVAIFLFPLVGLQLAGVALDVIGRQLEQLFHYINTKGFLLQPLENGQCSISCLSFIPRASSATIKNQKRQLLQPMKNKEKVKNRF